MNPFATIPFQGQAIAPNPPVSSRLASGASVLLGYGNYLVKPGPQTAVQWKDSYSGLWRNWASDPAGAPIFVPSDGSNYRIMNVSGTIQGANITAAGSGYNQANTSITFGAPVAPGVTATALAVVGGSLSFTVTNGGSGYSDPILVVQAPTLCGGTPGQCIPATITPTLSGGVITGVTVNFAGAGYVQLPTITVLDPTGTGAVITPTITNGTATNGGLTGIIMQNNGSLYDGTHIPTITITAPVGTGAAATALPNLALTGVTVGGTNTGYTGSVAGITTLGTSAASQPIAVNGDTTLPRAGRFIVDQTTGALGTPVIEDAGIGFQTVPLAKPVGNATTDGSTNATFTAVVGGVTNSLILWKIG